MSGADSSDNDACDREEEYLLRENAGRFVMFPILHQNLYDMYLKHKKLFWTVEEIDLSTDVVQFSSPVALTEGERHAIKHVLAFFAASDGIVMENLATSFFKEVQIMEARLFYSFQIMIEAVHGETYSLLLTTLVKDTNERNHPWDAVQTMPTVGKGQVDDEVDAFRNQRQQKLCTARYRVCYRRRRLFQRFILSLLLVPEERIDARSVLQQRTHFSR